VTDKECERVPNLFEKSDELHEKTANTELEDDLLEMK